MKPNIEYVTVEIELPAKALELLDQFAEYSSKHGDTDRQELIEIAVMNYLYDRRNSGIYADKELKKEFRKAVMQFYDEWQFYDDGEEAAEDAA